MKFTINWFDLSITFKNIEQDGPLNPREIVPTKLKRERMIRSTHRLNWQITTRTQLLLFFTMFKYLLSLIRKTIPDLCEKPPNWISGKLMTIWTFGDELISPLCWDGTNHRGWQISCLGQKCIIFQFPMTFFFQFVITHLSRNNSRVCDKCSSRPNVYLIRSISLEN